MIRNVFVLAVFTTICHSASAQTEPPKQKQNDVDTTMVDYDELFSELDQFLDSISTPRSFFLVNLGLSTSYLNYETATNKPLASIRKIIFNPGISYLSKSGFGVSVGSSIIREKAEWNAFQFSVSGSYDYVKNRKFVTGVSYTRYFTKDSLRFYTSPLENAVNGYFTYRNAWLKPSISVSYGWGTRSEYSRRQAYLKALRLVNGYTVTNTEETIGDFAINTSVRHDFYWLDVFGKNDNIRLTPQIAFLAGTQKFGFNQTSNSYGTIKATNTNVLYNSKDVYLDDGLNFQPLSLTAMLKLEYSTGKFFIQPQLIADYYFPVADNKFSASFLLNLGVIF